MFREIGVDTFLRVNQLFENPITISLMEKIMSKSFMNRLEEPTLSQNSETPFKTGKKRKTFFIDLFRSIFLLMDQESWSICLWKEILLLPFSSKWIATIICFALEIKPMDNYSLFICPISKAYRTLRVLSNTLVRHL